VVLNPADTTTWSNNQYIGVAALDNVLSYNGFTISTAATWTYDTTSGALRGSQSGTSGLIAKNQQSYEITVTPINFGNAGEPAKVTIGPGPLNEITFQTVRNGAGVPQWTSLSQIGSNIFLGKTSSIANPIRLRAENYVVPT
jgi:hypothetical protein